MNVFDWFFSVFYFFTLSRGSRYERANFLLWFSSSFIYLAIFYVLLALLGVQIYKSMYLPIFFLIFGINYLILWYIYIKKKRSELVIDSKGEVSKMYVIFYRLFATFFTFFSIAVAVISTIYYGKYISFL